MSSDKDSEKIDKINGDGVKMDRLKLDSANRDDTKVNGSGFVREGMCRDDAKRKALEADAICGLLKFNGMRRKRTFVGEKIKKSQLQQNVLKQVYEITNFPSTETRNELALLLSIPQRSVQVWFQNRRQICRKKDKERPGSSSEKVLVNEYSKFVEDNNSEKDIDDEVFDVPTHILIEIIEKCMKK